MKAQFESQMQTKKSEILGGLDAMLDGKIEQIKREIDETQESFLLNLRQVITPEIRWAMIEFQNFSVPSMPSSGNLGTLESIHSSPLPDNHLILFTPSPSPSKLMIREAYACTTTWHAILGRAVVVMLGRLGLHCFHEPWCPLSRCGLVSECSSLILGTCICMLPMFSMISRFCFHLSRFFSLHAWLAIVVP